MRSMHITIAIGLLLCGCQGTGPAKHDNPVVGPPPPRLPSAKIRENQIAAGTLPRTPATDGSGRVRIDDDGSEERLAANIATEVARDPSGIQRISLTEKNYSDLPPFEDGMVVAMVNDQPIFAGEVLAPHAIQQQLKGIEKQLQAQYGKAYKPEMMHRVRAGFINSLLKNQIERKVLVQAAKATFKKQQMEGLNKAVDAEWAEHVQQMMQQNKVNSTAEFEELMKLNNYDIEADEAAFKEQQVAMNFISYKAHFKFEPTRKEMLEYYAKHAADYEFPARVHWQQLVISNEAHGGTAGARKVLDKVVKELLDGADFGATVKKYGDGPKAETGGIWDWTVKGSLANKEVDHELFTLPVGETSGVIETASGFQIVQVIDRQEAGRETFESQQKAIEKKLKEEAFSERAKKVVAEIRAAAIIKTVFDGDTAPAEEQTSDEPF